MATSPSSPRYELPDTVEAIEYYYEQGLTDGLPVVPPTPERVQGFLDCAGLGPKEVLGTRASRNWVVTAEKAAINAVMAGCLPEYAPVVVAALRAMLEPDFNASGIAETTSGMSAPMILVNGPIRKKLDINSSWNLFGPGWRANSTIGRTLRLILMNVCREIPGVTDKSAFGSSARYTCCIAEDEETNPWEPWHVEKGYPIDSSTVTLFGALPPFSVFNYHGNTPESILDTLSQTIAANTLFHGEVIIILSGEHIVNIAPARWTKQQVKEYIANRVNELRRAIGLDQGRALVLAGVVPSGDDEDVPTTPNSIDLLVAGGGGGGVSALLPIFSNGRVSKTVIKPIDGE
ncbi:MAG: hypothetical protein V3U26_00205 [Dehalococcoidia bacterium]